MKIIYCGVVAIGLLHVGESLASVQPVSGMREYLFIEDKTLEWMVNTFPESMHASDAVRGLVSGQFQQRHLLQLDYMKELVKICVCMLQDTEALALACSYNHEQRESDSNVLEMYDELEREKVRRQL